MLPILDNDGIREADRHTIEDLGVPGMVLMENAATGVVDAIRDGAPVTHTSFEDGVRYMEFTEAVNVSLAEGRRVELPLAAPVILAAPSVEAAVLEKLYELPPPGEKYLYVPLFESYTEIRPTVEIRGYITKELWDNYRQQDDTPSTNDAADGQTDEGTTA